MFHHYGNTVKDSVERQQPMTLSGLCIFLGIARSSWGNYRQREGVENVVELVEEVIRTQKFELAACNLINANLISRDLGLKDTIETGCPAPFAYVSSEPQSSEEWKAVFCTTGQVVEAMTAEEKDRRMNEIVRDLSKP